MAAHNFGEKKTEYGRAAGKQIQVWQSPKYCESKKKAIEVIESNKYGLEDSDFWILMNESKGSDPTMVYSGLIISHNGCLKINDALESKFDPTCVTEDKEGYGGSLVLRYINKAQGLYAYGEVNPKNCKNEYPYAMAEKRLFDRVVLKISKIAYAGIYSEAEADEFKRVDEAPVKEPENAKAKTTSKKAAAKAKAMKADAPAEPAAKDAPAAKAPVVKCSFCGAVISAYPGKNNKTITPAAHEEICKKRFGRTICLDCIKMGIGQDNVKE